MKQRFLVPLCGLALLSTTTSGQDLASTGPSVIVVPTLDTEVQSGTVIAWSAAMPAMWRELCDHLGTDSIVLTPESKLANALNAWKFNPNVFLPKDGHLILSGNGTKASVQAARDQLKQKFDEAWPELDTLLQTPSNDSWFALCMLRQSLRFEPEFIPETEWAMLFTDSSGEEHAIKCFGTPANEADRFSDVIRVLRYKDPNTIISIKTSVPGEHLFLCTGSGTSMAETVKAITEAERDLNRHVGIGSKYRGLFSKGDLLEIPEVHFSGETQHLGDLGGTFQAPGKSLPQKFFFASHRVRLDMDATGVKIDARASAGGGFGGPEPKPAHNRAFVFDSPFTVVAWRDESILPYFAARIDGGNAFVKSSAYRKQSRSVKHVSVPPSYRSRCSVAERLLARNKAGGTPEQESMISRGLEYLKVSQNQDGSWGDDHSLETTATALLVFLARCETQDSPFYGDNIFKAIMWMVEQLNKVPPHQRPLKEVALATQALGEMNVLHLLTTKELPGKREAFNVSLKNVIDRQLPNGAWGAEDEDGYMTTGMCVEALIIARPTSLKIEDIKTAADRTKKYFIGTASPQNLTPELARLRAAVAVNACVAHAALAEPAPSEIKSVIETFCDQTSTVSSRWNETSSLDHWFIIPTAIRRFPDLTKSFMNDQVQELLKAQDSSGSFKSGPIVKDGSSLTAKEMELRRTIAALLAAEIPYRWKPTTTQGTGPSLNR